MRKILISTLEILFWSALSFSIAHSELVPEANIPKKSYLQQVKQWDRNVVDPYAISQTYVFDSESNSPYRPNTAGGHDSSIFAWRFNQTRLFSVVTSFVPDNTPIEGCENYQRDDINWEGPRCSKINERHLVCHLFMMTEQGQIAGIGRLQIARDSRLIKGKPFCYDVRAMSAPKEINGSMLITVSYIDSASDADPRVSPYEFPMTVLLRFKHEADGKLNITQDEHCLPNPNRIASIRQARQVLKANGCFRPLVVE